MQRGQKPLEIHNVRIHIRSIRCYARYHNAVGIRFVYLIFLKKQKKSCISSVEREREIKRNQKNNIKKTLTTGCKGFSESGDVRSESGEANRAARAPARSDLATRMPARSDRASRASVTLDKAARAPARSDRAAKAPSRSDLATRRRQGRIGLLGLRRGQIGLLRL